MIDAGVNPPTEEPSEEDVDVEIDYTDMSKKEIEELINKALDAGDFDTVAKLHKLI